MPPILRSAAAALAVLATGAAAVVALTPEVPDLAVPAGPWQPGHALDGLVFHTTDTVLETGAIMTDRLIFADGRFQSAKCQNYCDFGWSDYQTWTEGDVTRFTVTARCPDAPHTVVWHGTVTGDVLRFEGTWTSRRWYWTQQINITGAGSTTPHPDAPIAG